MAKRCLEHFSLESMQYDFMTFSDLSFLVDNPYYGTNVGSQDSRVSSYGTNICQIHSSDSAYMHNMDDTSAIFQKELSTSYSGYTNFNLWINNTDTIVISNGMLTSEVSSRDVRWAIILDDSEKLGWVVSRHVDGNCYVCGGDNDTGGLIYYAFMYGVISNSGGAGSGYIGNSLVSNKKMVGYNVPTSDATSTKTESVNVASEVPIPDTPKIGNGHAKIRLINTLPDTLVLYDNGRVNSQYFDTDAEVIGHTQDEPLSYDYQVKSDHLEISYDNWRDTIYWRGVQVKFNKKKVPTGYYHRIRIDAELYCKYNSSWAAIYFKSIIDNEEHDNGRLLQYYNEGNNIYHEVVTSGSEACDRYLVRGASSFEATDRWVSEDIFNSDCVKLMLEGVNQYHKATLKIYKITLIHDPIPEGFEYIRNINQLWVGYNNDLDTHVNFFEYADTFREADYQDQTYSDKNPKLYTFYGVYLVNTINGVTQNNHDENYLTNADSRPLNVASLSGIMTINVDTSIPSNVHVTYSLGYDDRVDFVGYRPQDYLVFYAKDSDDMLHFYYTYAGGLPQQEYFSSLSDAIAYIYDNYANINLYVDGVMWAKALS